jgi:hypothetical protein
MTVTTARTATTAADLELDAARFIDLVTFRRTGVPVGTPVLFIPDGDRLLVRTARDSGKLKRLAHTARVELTPADQKGRHRGATLQGTARVLPADAVAPTLARLHARYRIAGPLFSFVRRIRHQDDVIIEITLDRSRAVASAPGAEVATALARRVASTGIGPACLLLLVAIAAVACGGNASAAVDQVSDSPAASSAPAGVDAAPAPTAVVVMGDSGGLCAVFTADQASAILGEPVGPGVAKTSMTFGNQSCRYNATSSVATISLWLHPVSERSDWDHQVETLGAKPGSAITSVGEAAFRIGGTVERPRTKVAVFDAGHDFWLEGAGAGEPVRAGDAAVILAKDLAVALR